MLTRGQSSSELSPAMLCLFFLLALLLNFAVAGLALAGGCFKPIYYEALFQPIAQEAKGGDARLVGLSDHIAVKGEDPHGGGSGCMCGINNGRWDQMIFNNSTNDESLAPVSFKLLGVHIQYFEKDGKQKGKPVDIAAAKIAGCWNLGLAANGHRPFNAKGGHSDSGQVLEPGENLLSCLCLGPENRGGAGYAWIEVSYQPVVHVGPLKDGSQSFSLEPGAGEYFALQTGPAKSIIKLEGAAGLKLYTRDRKLGWASQLSQWQAHGNLTAELIPNASYWVLVRAGKSKAAAKLTASQAGQASPAGFVEAGPRGKRSFKSFILSGFEPSAKGGQQQEPKYNWESCCNRPGN